MSTETANILNAAMALSEKDRLMVARELIYSVKLPGIWSADDPGFHHELKRRLDAVERGEADLIDGKEALQRIQATLVEK